MENNNIYAVIDTNIIVRVGADKNGHWKVIE